MMYLSTEARNTFIRAPHKATEYADDELRPDSTGTVDSTSTSIGSLAELKNHQYQYIIVEKLPRLLLIMSLVFYLASPNHHF